MKDSEPQAIAYGEQMSTVILFHHVLGLTDGVARFAERLREAGHTVITPDLFDGHVFASIDEGSLYRDDVGVDVLLERARVLTAAVPKECVYMGISLGVVPAQVLMQANPRAVGGVFISGFIDLDYIDDPWPSNIPVQVHTKADDPFMAEGDGEAARSAAARFPTIELFTYPGAEHLFTDDSTPDYDAEATDTLILSVEGLLNSRT